MLTLAFHILMTEVSTDGTMMIGFPLLAALALGFEEEESGSGIGPLAANKTPKSGISAMRWPWVSQN